MKSKQVKQNDCGMINNVMHLTLSYGRPLSYRNQSIDLHSKSMDWFLYDKDLRHERVNIADANFIELVLCNSLRLLLIHYASLVRLK